MPDDETLKADSTASSSDRAEAAESAEAESAEAESQSAFGTAQESDREGGDAQSQGAEDDLYDRNLRLRAEIENQRRRFERERAEAGKYAVAGFARDLLATVDNLGRALSGAARLEGEAGKAAAGVISGVEMIAADMQTIFLRHGVRKIDPVGERFDPNFHQAMFEVPTDDALKGTVMDVIDSGYVLHDRVLRPARVSVSTPLTKTPREGATATKGETGDTGDTGDRGDRGDNGDKASDDATGRHLDTEA